MLSFLVWLLVIAPEAFSEDPNPANPCNDESLALVEYLDKHEEWLRDNHLLQGNTILGVAAPLPERLLAQRTAFPVLASPSCEAHHIANLVEDKLSGRYLAFADLRRVTLPDVKFTDVLSMRYADLNHAQLQGTQFVGVDLGDADLSDANLQFANLSQADFARAELKRTNLNETIVKGTKFAFANVEDAIYSPRPTDPPSNEVVGMKFVHTVEFGTMRESGMAQLRKVFKDLHLRDLERDATFAIRRHSATPFEYVLFQLPVGWGRAPGRAIKIMLAIFILSTSFYAFVIGKQNSQHGSKWASRILRARLSGHLTIENRNFKIADESCVQVLRTRGLGIVGWSLWFSALSAFHIGWRDLNFGTWLTRVQPKEFVLRGYGALRMISGVQSLLSVYLLAIWAVTTFGRPFE